MDVAFGHTNMDFDCLGSLILVKKLFPGYVLVRSNRIHPAAENIFEFYKGYFDFLVPKNLSGEQIDNIIIVDTCLAGRVSEYFTHIRSPNPIIRIFDHHYTEHCDILGAQLEEGHFGANTSLLGKMAMKAGVVLTPEEATIALTAIYADTGRLIFENVSRDDYEVSAWLLDMGASLRLVKSFLETVREENQIAVLNHLRPKTHLIHGNVILLSYLELEENVAGLAAVVEKIMDIQNPDAYFAVFYIRKDETVLLIARSQKKKIDLHALLSIYGGGGHQLAASAKITGWEGKNFFEELKINLEFLLKPATRAKDIMTKNVFTIHETTSLLDASMFLERVDHTAVPVVDKEGEVSGFISLRDIMKGRKHGKMQSSVKAYMSRPVVSAGSMATMREIEHIFHKDKIGHLPILENGKLLGIVTRWDYLQFQKKSSDEEE
ncbi:MAG: CBS domain-containing protein [Treponema sp.]|jgi:tRNA nucleotidyltransferase (CCA-adding enzyme)|nr:CBS domain-containing protein [Treponema sp.]